MTTTNEEGLDPLGILDSSPADTSKVPPPDELERQTTARLTTLFEKTKSSRLERQRLWEYYRLMLKGESLIARTKNSAEVLRVVLDADPRKPRSQDNLMRTNNRAFVGKLVKAIPAIRARPRTHDRSDMIAAELMDSWLDYGWFAEKFKLKFKRAVSCIPWAGTGILQPYWDVLGGRKIAVCPQCEATSEEEGDAGEPCAACGAQMMEGAPMGMSDPSLPPEMQAQLQDMDARLQQATAEATPKMAGAQEGQLRVRVIHPYDFYPDPGASDMEEAQFVFIARTVPVNVARTEFPDKALYIEKEDGLWSEKYVAALSGLANARIETVVLDNHVRLIEYYEMPSGRFPKGRIIYMANNRILEERDNIYASLLKRLPFYLFRGDVDLGELWGEEIISQAEMPQRERDILLTQVRRHRELTGNPKYVTAWNAGVDADFLDETPGEILKIKPNPIGFKALQVPAMPNWMPGEMQRLKDSVQEKFGITPYELGQGDTSSGRFAAFLDTQANAIVAPMLIEIYQEWLEMNRAWIVLGQYFMPEDRVWTVTGGDKILSYSWGKANVLPGWDVYLIEDDAISKNPVMRLQQAENLLKEGYFNDPTTGVPDMKAFRRMAGLRTDGVSPDAEISERIYATQMPEMIRQALEQQDPSLLPQPQPFDNAIIIVEELLGWLQTKGRSDKPEIVQAVTQLWVNYSQTLIPDDASQMMDPMLIKMLPNPKMMQAWQMTQQQPQGEGPGRMVGERGGIPSNAPDERQETAGKVAVADAAAEQAATGGQPHEG